MQMKIPFKLLFSIVSILVLVTLLARTAKNSGYFVDIRQVSYGTCEKINGPEGAEDINIDRNHNVAFISSGNAREVFDSYRSGIDKAQIGDGAIWLLDLSLPASKPHILKVDVGGPFHPHGIDLLTMENGERELYVINHPKRDEHEVLVFSVTSNHDLILKERIVYPELISPNDIEAFEQNHFFVTNDHGSPQSSLMARIEEYLGLSRSSVSYYDGKRGSLIIERLNSANGIKLSSDKRSLYIAEAIGRSIKKYKRGNSLHRWSHIETLYVDTALDNLEWDKHENLLAGAHPKLFDLISHFRDKNKISPSHVVRIDTANSPMSYETIYMDDGNEISGSSVATRLDGMMLIGSVAEPYFLRCIDEDNESI